MGVIKNISEIKFENIQKANELIKTTNIKGKDYAEVNQRIKAFKYLYPEGSIYTKTLKDEEGICEIKAFVFKEAVLVINDEGKEQIQGNLLATGTAYEVEGSSFINKTSYIENCETSAVGRALGMAGFGIDTSVASYEEVANAIEQQNNLPPKISKSQEEALDKAITNRNIDDNTVLQILQKYGYDNTADILIKDYMNIVQEFQKLVQK